MRNTYYPCGAGRYTQYSKPRPTDKRRPAAAPGCLYANRGVRERKHDARLYLQRKWQDCTKSSPAISNAVSMTLRSRISDGHVYSPPAAACTPQPKNFYPQELTA